MTEESIVFDCDPESDERGFTVPDGNYTLTVWEVTADKSKNGDPKLNVKFGVNGSGGKWLWHNITLIPKGKPGHSIAVHALKTLGFSVDKSRVNLKPSDLIGKICRAEVYTEKYNGKSYNRIAEMLYADSKDEAEMPESEANF